MLIQSFKTVRQNAENTVLEITSFDTPDSSIKDVFHIGIHRGEGPSLVAIRAIVISEFQKRYHNKGSLFCVPSTFGCIIENVHDMRHPDSPPIGTICCLRERQYHTGEIARPLPLNVEFDICKQPNLPVEIVFNKKVRWEPASPGETIVTSINPLDIDWDIETSSFVNHPDADLWNTHIDEYRQNFMASVNEELHEELAAIAAAEAEERYDQDQ